MKKTSNKSDEIIFEAIKIVPGLAIGPAHAFHRTSFHIDEFDHEIKDPDREITILDNAISETVKQLKITIDLNAQQLESHRSLFESHLALLEDDVLRKEIKEAIKQQNRSAAYAVIAVLQRKKEHFLNLEDEYFRDRAFDIIDLKNRLLQTIAGVETDYSVSVPSIIFADHLSPSDTIHFDRKSILGFVTDTGGRTSHAAIMAKSMHIPYVVDNFSLAKLIQNSDYVILDGYEGNIIINPEQKTLDTYQKIRSKYLRSYSKLLKASSLPAITQDGVAINILANIEFSDEIPEAKEVGANGIGLLRTETIFIEKEKVPTEQEQFEIFHEFAHQMAGQPVTIRTIDAGGDKIIPELQGIEEENPYLGWRAIRFCLDQPEIFKSHLRAIIRANDLGNIRILIPMIISLEEVEATKQMIEEAKEELIGEGMQFKPDIELGLMIETPAAVMMSQDLAAAVDFFSIGSNDLTQYTLAVDRTNNKIAPLFNDLHPAVLKLMRATVETANKYQIGMSICGEMAGNPEAIPVLLGLGFTELSMVPGQIPVVKKIIRKLKIKQCYQLVDEIMQLNRVEEIKHLVATFIQKRFKELKDF